jgi:hypothetical protein
MRPDGELPDLVRAYLERCLPSSSPSAETRICQTGVMWKHPGAHALCFTATERFATDRVAFTWHARFPMLGPLAMHVTDDYTHGRGRMRARIAGVPVMRASGPEIDAGSALRYLAELPWAPSAIACNRELEWRKLDARTVEVSTVVGAAWLAVQFEFDEAGDIARASARDRPRARKGGYERVAWGGEFGCYDVLGGTRMPTAADAYWDLPAGRFEYWRGTVTEATTVGVLERALVAA